jgi:hypothetical protein
MHIDEGKKFDKRTIEKNLKEGIVSAEEWKKFLRSLPDISDNVDFVIIRKEEKEEASEDQQEKPEESVEKDETPEKE